MTFIYGDKVQITVGENAGRFAWVEEEIDVPGNVGRMVDVVLDGWGTRLLFRPGCLMKTGVSDAAQDQGPGGGGEGHNGGAADAGHPLPGGAE